MHECRGTLVLELGAEGEREAVVVRHQVKLHATEASTRALTERAAVAGNHLRTPSLSIVENVLEQHVPRSYALDELPCLGLEMHFVMRRPCGGSIARASAIRSALKARAFRLGEQVGTRRTSRIWARAKRPPAPLRAPPSEKRPTAFHGVVRPHMSVRRRESHARAHGIAIRAQQLNHWPGCCEIHFHVTGIRVPRIVHARHVSGHVHAQCARLKQHVGGDVLARLRSLDVRPQNRSAVRDNTT
mmetsp:Transcript_4591/g.11929  ORF Transcript_4591/g.11929 Transcript_4591/m.11929 type:complete len:244 (+) Transcript_4591:1125-1856(+)